MFVFGGLSGRLSGRFGARAVLIAGTAISVAPFVLLTVARAHQWEILIAMVLQGVGFGLAYAAMSSLVVQAVPAQQTGVASGMNANIRTIGGSLGAAVMSSIVTAGTHHGSLPANSGYTHGFLALTIAAAAAAGAAVLVPKLRSGVVATESAETMPHAELAMLAAGTVVGDESE
jgi:MFS family permease